MYVIYLFNLFISLFIAHFNDQVTILNSIQQAYNTDKDKTLTCADKEDL